MHIFSRAPSVLRAVSHQTGFASSRLNPNSLLALLLLSGCSLKSFGYLTEGMGGAGGDMSMSSSGGISDGGASATEGGAGGALSSDAGGSPSVDAGGGNSSTSTGGSTAEPSDGGCTAPLTECTGDPVCTDLSHGTTSGATVNHCGSCDTTCSLINATSATCANGKCTPVCKTGFTNCNGTTANDGCEADLTSPVSCGECGHKCSVTGVQTTKCNSGACVPTCLPRYANCDGDVNTGTDLANNGCEVYLDSLKGCGLTCAGTVACASNQVCNAGVCGAAQGLVAFSVPLTTAGQNQRYAYKFNTPPNLTDSTITFRTFAPGATAGTLVVFVTAVGFAQSTYYRFALNTMSTGWTDVTLPVDSATGVSGTFDPSSVYQITFELRADDAGPWLNPTLLYVDAMWSSNGALKDSFDTTTGSIIASTMQVVDGSTFAWTAALP